MEVGAQDDCDEDLELSDADRHRNALIRSLSVYSYPCDQHRAARNHVEAVHHSGGAVYFNLRGDFSLVLAPVFVKGALFPSQKYIYERTIKQCKEQEEALRPRSRFARAASLGMILAVGSCSYHVAPKSKAEILGWGTFFATWGMAEITNTIHRNIRVIPNRREMLKTVSAIIEGNRPILEAWNGDTPWHSPK